MGSCLCGRHESCSVCEETHRRYLARMEVENAIRAERQKAGLYHCNWSECICDKPELWPTPEYKVGETWAFYGGHGGTFLIESLYPETQQMIILNTQTKKRTLLDLWPGRYSNCGTPELRRRITEV